MAAAVFDPFKPAKYVIHLSPNLLPNQRASADKSLFTSIRYNFKPEQTETSHQHAKISKASTADKYKLDLKPGKQDDTNSSYGYTGTKESSTTSYILQLHPEKNIATLSPCESEYTFNLTSTHEDHDASKLAKEHAHITPFDPADQQGTNDSNGLFGDGEPDVSNPFDYRHYLNGLPTGTDLTPAASPLLGASTHSSQTSPVIPAKSNIKSSAPTTPLLAPKKSSTPLLPAKRNASGPSKAAAAALKKAKRPNKTIPRIEVEERDTSSARTPTSAKASPRVLPPKSASATATTSQRDAEKAKPRRPARDELIIEGEDSPPRSQPSKAYTSQTLDIEGEDAEDELIIEGEDEEDAPAGRSNKQKSAFGFLGASSPADGPMSLHSAAASPASFAATPRGGFAGLAAANRRRREADSEVESDFDVLELGSPKYGQSERPGERANVHGIGNDQEDKNDNNDDDEGDEFAAALAMLDGGEDDTEDVQPRRRMSVHQRMEEESEESEAE